MKAILFTCAAFALSAQTTASAQSLGDFLRGIIRSEPQQETPTSTDQTGPNVVSSLLSQSDAESGLKQALTLGARAVASQLSVTDGYFGDANIQIPLPGRLSNIQNQMSRFGLSGPLDDLQLRMNRAAEDAAPYAVDLVIDAVESLTIEDALSLLSGGDTAATDLLRQKTELKLQLLAKPYVENALEDAGALQMAEDLSSKYQLSQFNFNPREDLVDHAVNQALEGMFFYLAEEEKSIRNNPVDQTTELLRRVFGE